MGDSQFPTRSVGSCWAHSSGLETGVKEGWGWEIFRGRERFMKYRIIFSRNPFPENTVWYNPLQYRESLMLRGWICVCTIEQRRVRRLGRSFASPDLYWKMRGRCYPSFSSHDLRRSTFISGGDLFRKRFRRAISAFVPMENLENLLPHIPTGIVPWQSTKWLQDFVPLSAILSYPHKFSF